MKFFLAVFALVAAVNGSALRSSWQHNISQNVTDMVMCNGYPVQNFTVTTSDGYMLDVIRVPGGRGYKTQFEQLQKEQRDENVRTDKPAVLLWHAMLSSSEDFVIGGPTEGLAFVLADAGYDVFMANTRGSTYGRKHTTLNPEKDSAFWRFCMQDIARKDLPAVIDEILKMTGNSKLYYVGHMEGSTALFVLNSEVPAYNEKIAMMVALGPIAYMKHSTNQAMKAISEHYQSKTWVMKNIGANEFHPANDFVSEYSQDCVSRGVNERICQNPFFLINGYESKMMNQTTVMNYMPRLPAGTSTRNVLHYGQLIKSGRFESYCEENKSCGEYDLAKVTMPVAVVYAPEDKLSAETDVQTLIAKLPAVIENVRLNQVNNNLDLLFCNNVRTVVYDTLVNLIKSN